MKRTLLISGQRANFTTLSLDIDKRELSILAEYPAPFNVSWVEPWSSHGDFDRLIGLSEGAESGLLYTFEIDHARKRCNITSQKSTLGDPAHCKYECLPYSIVSGISIHIYWTVGMLHDRSALALSTVSNEKMGIFRFMRSQEVVFRRLRCFISHLNHRQGRALTCRRPASGASF